MNVERTLNELEEETMDDATPIDDEVYQLGPVGIWPFKYRVRLSDRSGDDSTDGQWWVSLERRTASGSNGWKRLMSTALYSSGPTYENRTKAGDGL